MNQSQALDQIAQVLGEWYDLEPFSDPREGLREARETLDTIYRICEEAGVFQEEGEES